MSESYQNDTVIINFTFLPFMPAVGAVIPVIEATLMQFGAKPHWGRCSSWGRRPTSDTIPNGEILSSGHSPLPFNPPSQSPYIFRDLAERLDPGHKFRNDFLNNNIFVDNSTPPSTVENDVNNLLGSVAYGTGTGSWFNNLFGAIGLVTGNILGGLYNL